MKRTTILMPVLVAFAIGMVVGGRLLPAEAEQPAPPVPAACDQRLAQREQELRQTRQAAARDTERAKATRDAAAASAAEGAQKIRELEKVRAREHERAKRLEQQLGGGHSCGLGHAHGREDLASELPR